VLQAVLSLTLSFALLAGSDVGMVDGTSVAGASARPEPETIIRKSVREVRLGFFVSSQNGRPVPNLTLNDVRVFEDETPVGDVTAFYRDQDLPLRLLLMVDASDSMTKGFGSERTAAAAFLKDVVRPGVDQSAVAAFTTKLATTAVPIHTSDDELQAIGAMRSAGLTALFDSILQAAPLLPTSEATPTRRVLVLLSDGNDNYSLHSLNDAITVALRSDIVIYAVTAHKAQSNPEGDSNLRKLTDATGGRLFILKKYDESEKAFAEMNQEIRSQYAVTFRPVGNACGYHRLRVDPLDAKLQARSRSGFLGECDRVAN
jgi:VWFA-related protein